MRVEDTTESYPRKSREGETHMPECQNCHETWSWKQTFKVSFMLGGDMICPYCDEKQYYTAKFRKRSALTSIILSTIIILGILLWDFSYLPLFGLIGIPLISIFVHPCFVKLSNEDEPLL